MLGKLSQVCLDDYTVRNTAQKLKPSLYSWIDSFAYFHTKPTLITQFMKSLIFVQLNSNLFFKKKNK